MRYDHRFGIEVADDAPRGLTIEILGRERWRDWRTRCPNVPPIVGPTLPAIIDAKGVRGLPLAGVFRSDSGPKEVMIEFGSGLGFLDGIEGGLASACLEGDGY
jgi:hypothetical protein